MSHLDIEEDKITKKIFPVNELKYFNCHSDQVAQNIIQIQ